jgi:hypothetical protein
MKLKFIFLDLLLVLSWVLFCTGSADSIGDADIKALLYFNKETVSQGEIFKMSLKLVNIGTGDKTNSVTFEIEYDSDTFELVRNNPETGIKNGYIEFTTRKNPSEGNIKRINVMYVNTSEDTNLKESSTVFSVKFRVKKVTQPGERKFKLKPIKMLDSNFKVYRLNNGEEVYSKVNVTLEKGRANNLVFVDVEADHWAKEFIDEMVNRSITFGIDNYHFDPKGVVTRAQFAAFLVRALDIEVEDYAGEFKDIDADDWYSKEVAVAMRAGIVKGFDDGMFRPNQQITREQMSCMVMMAYKYEMADKEIIVDNNVLKFTDSDEISGWAGQNVKEAYSLGIMRGMSQTKLEPLKTAMREQAAAVVMKLLEACELL